MENFAQRLKTSRENRGFSQKDVATAAGISQQYYGRIEKGQGEPNLESLVKIATKLNVTTDYLLGIEKKANTVNVNGTEFEITIHIKANEKTSS